MKLYPERLNRDFNATDENEKILSAYDKVLREQYMLAEDATADAKKTLDAIIGSTKDDGGDVYKMAMGIKKSYEKNKGFSKDQASWIYKMSKSMFKESIDEAGLSTPEKHQLKIAKSTLKMHDAGAAIMGGMTKEEARAFLKKIGWSDAKIKKFEG